MSKLAKALTAAAGNAGGDPLYAEDVFSTYVYTGTGAPLTITNGIDLAGEGGMVWGKSRTTNVFDHQLMDTERGTRKVIASNKTDGEASNGDISAFNSDGFSLSTGNNLMLSNGQKFASWSFRKAEKFFDVVTYTGNGTAGRTVAHNLGSVPAVIIVKSTSNGAYNWMVYHKDLGNTNYLRLNENTQTLATAGAWNNTTPTDSEFTLGGASVTNGNGESFVAYLFASDAGGFGDDEDESIIKCGTYTGNGGSSLNSINVGFEPQWIMVKNSSATGNWHMLDVMRGCSVAASGSGPFGGNPFYANLVNGEGSGTRTLNPTATGFEFSAGTAAFNNNGNTFIYIAIRRPMKTPEYGTEVLSTVAYTGTGADKFLTSSSVVDLAFNKKRTSGDWTWTGRLQGAGRKLVSNGDFSEGTDPNGIKGLDYNNGVLLGTNGDINGNGDTYISYMLSRATGFFDVVAYSGNGSASGQVINHNLGVTPEIIIIKGRSNSGREWHTYVSSQGQDKALFINSSGAEQANTALVGGTINSTQYELKVDFGNVNGNGETYITYLFATLAGVSKVGSYTGTGADLNVDCGFSAGARFVLIKRTDSSGGWHVWDSSRGISASTDPYLLLNSDAAQVTNTDYIDPLSSGFTVTSSAPAALNASGGNYIFLAIA